MAASGTAAGLSSTDLDQIREGLRSGRRPKVVFTASAGQISGQTGQVVELTDPDASDEWVVVRFGGDELPFSPTDRAVPVRGLARRRDEPKPPEFKLGTPVPAPRERKTPAASATTRTTTTATTKPAKPTDRAAPKAASNGAAPKPATDATAAKAANHAAPRPAKVRTPAPLTVTLAYADREWTVAARLGSKVLAKPYGIKPAEALRMVSLLDVPGVHDAVESIIATERVEAENRARRLRDELAEIEARLAELTGRA